MRKGYSKGMSILETCIAIMILSIIISGVLGGLYLASNIGATTRNRAKAIQIVKGRMEELTATSYADLVNDIEGGYLYDNPDRVPYTLTTTVAAEFEDDDETGQAVMLRIDWVHAGRNCFEELVTFRRRE